MRRFLWITSILIMIAAAALLFGQVSVWDGHFLLSVKVKNKSATPIQVIQLKAFGDQIVAQYVVDQSIARQPCDVEMKIVPYTNEPIDVCVPCYGKDLALLPVPIKRGQFQYLALVSELSDATRTGTVPEITDRSISPAIT